MAWLPASAKDIGRGFTLVEVVVVTAILGVLVAGAAPLSRTFLSQNALGSAAATYGQSLRRAETLARGMKGDAAWGVAVTGTTTTIYKGASYTARDQAFDEAYPFGATLTVSGVTEVNFTKFTGLPNVTGTTTFSAPDVSVQEPVSINAKGTVNY